MRLVIGLAIASAVAVPVALGDAAEHQMLKGGGDVKWSAAPPNVPTESWQN